jgi:hypothetical protein
VSFWATLKCHVGFQASFARVSCMFFMLIYGSFRAHLGFHVRVSYEEFLSGFLEVFFGFHLGSLGL